MHDFCKTTTTADALKRLAVLHYINTCVNVTLYYHTYRYKALHKYLGFMLFSDTGQFQQAVHACGRPTPLTGSMFFSNAGNVGPILTHSRADIGPCYTRRRFMHINLQ